MLKDEFFHDLLRKYVILFGQCFQNITIARTNSLANKVQEIKVPISYGPRQKFLARLEGEPEGRSPVGLTLPRISFEITNVQYATDRKTNSLNLMLNKKNLEGKNTYKKVWNPVPYDIFFQLNIMTKTTEDGSKIIEQILPWFSPDWTVSAKLLEDMDNVVLDIPIVIQSVTLTDTYEGMFTERRVLIWTLDFTLKGWFFGPVRENKIIKIARTNFYPSFVKDKPFERSIVTPGLTENEKPTTYSSTMIRQALASAQINGAGQVEYCNIDVTGIGYDSAFVTFEPSPTGEQARGTVVITHGVLDKIAINNPGSGYTSPPRVWISPPDLGSIPFEEIDENDNYGFVVEYENVDDK